MKHLAYQRTIIAYHGCDQTVADRVLLQKQELQPSSQRYDWLGTGVYFWEHGPQRAQEWAEWQVKRGKITHPTVIGAVIQLGRCFDLLDTRFTKVLSMAWASFELNWEKTGKPLPSNKPSHPSDSTATLRFRDCALINWALDQMSTESAISFDSIRGMFQEGEPAYPGSEIRSHSHIQIAIRNPECIIGYFLPS